jgi:hypothetical protein
MKNVELYANWCCFFASEINPAITQLSVVGPIDEDFNL